MAGVASKNIYSLLETDGDSDSPQQVTTPKTPQAPGSAKPAAAAAGARRQPGGNEGAFRDRGAGADRNRAKPTEESGRGGARGGRDARVRGGRGARFPRTQDDRHSKSAPSGSEKQAAQSWGATEGEAELKDEQAGEAIAQKEQKEDAAETPATPAEEAPAQAEVPEEEEDHHVSYSDWLAESAEKKLALDAENALKIRQVDNSKLKKEWAAAKPLVKEDDDFIASAGGKAKRQREHKVKNLVQLEDRFIEQDRPPRGGGRGGRGEFRGGRGGRGGRGDFRGDYRGGRGGGRGDFRGGRGAVASPQLNTDDTNAFPSLGS